MVLSRGEFTSSKSITAQIEREQIKSPNGNLVEIEIFGHGALCVWRFSEYCEFTF
jgi:putative protease